MAAHGLPRATGDIDIWLRNSTENALKTIRALKGFGAFISELSEEDFTAPDRIIQIGVEPCRIDLLTSISGVCFEEAWKNKIIVTVDGLEINVLSRSDLLKNKLSLKRDKDLSDIAWLEKNQLDDEYTRGVFRGTSNLGRS